MVKLCKSVAYYLRTTPSVSMSLMSLCKDRIRELSSRFVYPKCFKDIKIFF